MGKASANANTRAPDEERLAALERELAVLVRHLEGFGRRSDLYGGMGTGRAGYLLLMTLEEVGASTIGTLAATLGLDASTVTRQIAAMEAEGLIARGNDPQDRRCSIISASERGSSLMQSVRRRRMERIDAVLGEWPAEDLTALDRLLGRLNGAIAVAAARQEHRNGAQTSVT
jgi:DNA-binding MarR family transcriptional regulator